MPGNFEDRGFKLFVGGLSFQTDDNSLKNHFEKFGPLADHVVMKMSDSKRSRGFGFVSFERECDIKEAMKLKPHVIDGRTVDVKLATAREERDSSAVGGGSRRQKEGTADGDQEAKIMRKLFIGGLNYSTTEETMKSYFERYGSLEDCVIMKFPDSGRSRGFGFIMFEKSEQVDKCQADRPHQIDNKTIEVKRATPRTDARKPEAQASVKKLYVGSLTEDMTDEDLEEYFKQFGPVTNVEQMKWNDTGKKRGFGFIEFDDTDPVDKICLLGRHGINGKRLDVKKALSKQELEQLKRQRIDEELNAGRSSGSSNGRNDGNSDRMMGRGGSMNSRGGNMMGGNSMQGGGGNNMGMDGFNPMMMMGMMQMMMNMNNMNNSMNSMNPMQSMMNMMQGGGGGMGGGAMGGGGMGGMGSGGMGSMGGGSGSSMGSNSKVGGMGGNSYSSNSSSGPKNQESYNMASNSSSSAVGGGSNNGVYSTSTSGTQGTSGFNMNSYNNDNKKAMEMMAALGNKNAMDMMAKMMLNYEDNMGGGPMRGAGMGRDNPSAPYQSRR